MVEITIKDDGGVKGTESGDFVMAIISTIEEDGLVQGVSTGTPVMPDREGYKRISLRPTLYGQGAAILALAEENADKKLERKEKEANGFYL